MSYDKQSCEEFYTDPASLHLALGSQQGQMKTFISQNLFIVSLERGGVLVRTIGAVVKAEPIEMNCVKVTSASGKEHFYELGEDVIWMELGEHDE